MQNGSANDMGKLNEIYLTNLKKFIAKNEKNAYERERIFQSVVVMLEQQANNRELLKEIGDQPRWIGIIGNRYFQITANLFFDFTNKRKR